MVGQLEKSDRRAAADAKLSCNMNAPTLVTGSAQERSTGLVVCLEWLDAGEH
jgi:hypothetical protein